MNATTAGKDGHLLPSHLFHVPANQGFVARQSGRPGMQQDQPLQHFLHYVFRSIDELLHASARGVESGYGGKIRAIGGIPCLRTPDVILFERASPPAHWPAVTFRCTPLSK